MNTSFVANLFKKSDIRFFASVGRFLVYVSFLIFLSAIYFGAVGNFEFHGVVVALYALPTFVTGVFFHMLPNPNKKVPRNIFGLLIALTLLLSYITYILGEQSLNLYFYYAYLISILYTIIYCYIPLKKSFISIEILSFSAYFSALLSSIIILKTGSNFEHYALSQIYSISVGMIFAVNSFSVPKTYGEDLSQYSSMLLAILLPILTSLIILANRFLVEIFIISTILYIHTSKLYKLPKYFKKVLSMKGIAKYIHLNMLIGHIISIVSIILAIVTHYLGYISLITFIHILCFGFILPEIVGHGSALLPTILRKGARKTKYIIITTPATIIPVTMRIFEETFFAKISGGFILIILILLVVLSIKFRK